MSFLSWQLTILIATVWVESLLWMAWQAQQTERRDRLVHRLKCNGRLEASNRRAWL